MGPPSMFAPEGTGCQDAPERSEGGLRVGLEGVAVCARNSVSPWVRRRSRC